MTLYTEEFYAKFATGWLDSARVLIPMVLDLTEPRSVLDVGCGTGTWLAQCLEHGAEEVQGVDGDYVQRDQLKIPADCFRSHDLSQPLDLGRRFDLVISLEVAEHIPEAQADAFVESLTRHGDALAFSAAIPFQGGTGHVNEQWPDYWADKLAARGYHAIDCIRTQVWHDERVHWWYAQNLILYATDAFLEAHPKLADARERSIPGPLRLAHPRKYLSVADPSRGSFSKNVRSLPHLAVRSLQKKWRKLNRPKAAT